MVANLEGGACYPAGTTSEQAATPGKFTYHKIPSKEKIVRTKFILSKTKYSHYLSILSLLCESILSCLLGSKVKNKKVVWGKSVKKPRERYI